jgi:hypothetical protein
MTEIRDNLAGRLGLKDDASIEPPGDVTAVFSCLSVVEEIAVCQQIAIGTRRVGKVPLMDDVP